MRYLSIKNFKKHQHYTNRRPPWIKLHAEVLDDYAFACLQDASKAHLMLLWVLASKMDNRIPYDLPFLAKKLGATSPIDVEELVLQGFVTVTQDDSAALADRKQSAMPEGEREAETETEGEDSTPRSRPRERRPAVPLSPELVQVRERWTSRVGEIPDSLVRKHLRGAVERHGESAMLRAIDAYVDARNEAAKTPKLAWFAEEVAVWVERSAPVVDENGMPTERGMAILAGSPS